jgi:hypothetical protein
MALGKRNLGQRLAEQIKRSLNEKQQQKKSHLNLGPIVASDDWAELF